MICELYMGFDVLFSSSTVENELHFVVEVIFVHIVLYVDGNVDVVYVDVVVKIIVKIDLKKKEGKGVMAKLQYKDNFMKHHQMGPVLHLQCFSLPIFLLLLLLNYCCMNCLSRVYTLLIVIFNYFFLQNSSYNLMKGTKEFLTF